MQQDIEIMEDITPVKSIEEEIIDQTQQKPNASSQKSHNDKHIFYSLKTSSFDTGNPSIFNVTMNSTQKKQSRHSVRIKSKQNLRNSITIKTSLPQSSFQTETNTKHSLFKSSSSIQRANKKVEIKNTEIPKIRLDSQRQKNKILWNDHSYDESFKLKIKNSQKRRNYFNVKELQQFEAQRKKNSAVILLKNSSNSLMNRKKYDILGKTELSPQKVKQFQFSAIEITKNIVEKSYGKYGELNRIRNQDRKSLLKPNKSYCQGLNVQKKQLISAPTRQYFDQKLMDGVYEQRGSLWRSNSYQLPRSKQILTNSMNRTGLIRNDKKEENYVRNVQFDHNIDLNPWNIGQQVNLSNQKSHYAAYKTQSKNSEEEHEFLNYYIKTSRQQK